MNINSLLRNNIKALNPYRSARDEYTGERGIFLDANENALGSAIDQVVNRYPDPRQVELKHRIAQLKGVQPEQIFLGNGSDEAIDLPMRAFCEPRRDNIILMPPTYGMYSVCATINDVAILNVALRSDFQIDVPRVIDSLTPRTKLIFICSPNNPSGNLMQVEAIETLLHQSTALVILDEAYIDFTTAPSWLQRLAEFENLLVLQTFSKAWGMANIRLGMAFAHPEIIKVLNKIKYPYNINGVTQQMALQALERVRGRDAMIQRLTQERKRLKTNLEQFDFVEMVFPSEANFLLVRFRDATRIYRQLLENNIVVRDRSDQLHCQNCLRITVGTPAENDILIQKLQRIADED
jgi:histidinol-phosphate aminotransferase